MTEQNCVSSTGPIGCFRVRCALGGVCLGPMEVAPAVARIADGPSEVESVIACLLDDATKMFIDNPFDEVAENMQKAADMLSRTAPPAQPTAQDCEICHVLGRPCGECGPEVAQASATPPSSLAQQVAAAQSEMATWSDGRIAGAQLEGGASTAPVAPEGWQDTIEALKYYADGHHFTLHVPEAWDTVSGEPMNFQEDEACTATVEDGSVAKMALDKIAAAPPAQQTAQASETDVDTIMTRLYRRFKEWNKRGFGPDDVTWCEVKADISALIATPVAQASAEPALFSNYKMDDGSTVAEFLGHPMRLVLIVDDDGFHVMWRESGENKSMIAPAASAAPAVPEEFVVAPRIETSEMVNAGIRKFKGMTGGYASLGEKLAMSYRAMIEAAPKEST